MRHDDAARSGYTCLRACLRTCPHTCPRTCLCTCLCTHLMSMCIFTYIINVLKNMSIHVHAHVYIHADTHAYKKVFIKKNLHTCHAHVCTHVHRIVDCKRSRRRGCWAALFHKPVQCLRVDAVVLGELLQCGGQLPSRSAVLHRTGKSTIGIPDRIEWSMLLGRVLWMQNSLPFYGSRSTDLRLLATGDEGQHDLAEATELLVIETENFGKIITIVRLAPAATKSQRRATWQDWASTSGGCHARHRRKTESLSQRPCFRLLPTAGG